VDPDTIDYEVTIVDPNAIHQPWKVAIPLIRDSEYRIFEYACQEGNYAVSNILSRAAERAP